MESIIQAQLRARSDVDSIIHSFIKNTQTANILSAELKERKSLGDQHMPVRASDETLESAWVSARNSLDAAASDTILSSFFGSKRDEVTPADLKEILRDIQVTDVADATMGYGSSLLFATATGVKSYLGLLHDDGPHHSFANYKTFLERVNGFHTHIALCYRDPLLMDFSGFTYDCALLLNAQESLSFSTDLSTSTVDATKSPKLTIADTLWNHLQPQGVILISCETEEFTYLSKRWGKPTRFRTTSSGATVIGIFTKPQHHLIELDAE